jgi:uncharacterized protein (TIRG00374 family)
VIAISAPAPTESVSGVPVVVWGALIAAAVLGCVWAMRHPDWLTEGLRRHRTGLRRGLLVAVVVVVVAVLASQLDHLRDILHRIEGGDPWWLGLAVFVEVFSFVGYVGLTHNVFARAAPRLNWAASWELTLGGVVATRVFSAGGAGGIAFTAWALRAAGMVPRTVARAIAAFLALLYAAYMAAMIVGGLIPGAPTTVRVIGVAVGAIVTGLCLLLVLIPGDLERRARRLAEGHGRLSRLAARLATVPTVAGEAIRGALRLARERPWLLGWALLWWIADVIVLEFCFAAFGTAPGIGVLLLGYFIGHIGNLLPLPGGIGGVEGGMIGVFAACGVPLAYAVVATLAYQAISTWLPVLPGLVAAASLRRRVARWRLQSGEQDDTEALPAPAG